MSRLRDEAVRRRRWLDDDEFLDLLAAVSVLPGPSSTQLAIVVSRRRAGWRTLLVGGACFIAPAMCVVLVLAWAYTRYGSTVGGVGVLYGVEPVVVVIVIVALWELGSSALEHRWHAVLAIGSVIAYFERMNVVVPLVFAGVVASLVANRRRITGTFVVVPLLPALAGARPRPSTFDVLTEFLKLGTVVFGSGYVLLAFLRADLVAHLHWLTEQQVLDAIAAGQVTPEPVFTTATFVGYLIGGTPIALAAVVLVALGAALGIVLYYIK